MCEDMRKFLEEMYIDDERIYVLTKFAGKMGNKKKVTSDHNVLFCKFSILFEALPNKIRKEFFNFKSQEGKKAFLFATSNSEKLSKCFAQNRTFAHNANSFFHELNSCVHKSF